VTSCTRRLLAALAQRMPWEGSSSDHGGERDEPEVVREDGLRGDGACVARQRPASLEQPALGTWVSDVWWVGVAVWGAPPGRA